MGGKYVMNKNGFTCFHWFFFIYFRQLTQPRRAIFHFTKQCEKYIYITAKIKAVLLHLSPHLFLEELRCFSKGHAQTYSTFILQVQSTIT